MEEPVKKPTCWKPTKAEIKLVEVMVNPANRYDTAKEWCKKAGVGRDVYYVAFKKPEFCEYYTKASMGIVRRSVAPVLNAFEKEAVRGSYQHGKLLLELQGIYTENTTVTEESYGDRLRRIRARLSAK